MKIMTGQGGMSWGFASNPVHPIYSSLKTDLRFARPKIRGSTERAKRRSDENFALSVDPRILGRAKRRSVFRLHLQENQHHVTVVSPCL